jgi:hypothetical protein
MPAALLRLGDGRAIGYAKELGETHPLLRFYRMLAESNQDLVPRRTGGEQDGTSDAEAVFLVKEVRSLLATEALVRGLGCRAALFVNDPVLIVDRLFAHAGRSCEYLQPESSAVTDPAFCRRFLRREAHRVARIHRVVQRLPDYSERAVLLRVLAVALIQHMFRLLAARYPEQVTVVSYPSLHRHPQAFVDKAVAFYGPQARARAEAVLSSSTIHAAGQDRLLWTSGASNGGSEPMALTGSEVLSAYQLLSDLGLAENQRWLKAPRTPPADTPYGRAMSRERA